MIDNALDRRLYETSYDPADPGRPTWCGRRATRSRAPSTRTSRTRSSPPGESYWFFENTFDRDSYDGNGATRITVNNDPTIAVPQRQLERHHHQLLHGVTSDDVVAHEWGHAYTEYTQRPDLPVAVRCAQRVLLRHLGRDARPDQQPRRRGRGRHHRQASGRHVLALHARCRRLELIMTPRRASPGPARPAPRRSARPSTTTGFTDDVVRGDRPGRRGRTARPPTAARRSPTRPPSPASSPTSTAAPAPSGEGRQRRRPPAPPASSSATTSAARSSGMSGTARRHHPGGRWSPRPSGTRDQAAAATGRST